MSALLVILAFVLTASGAVSIEYSGDSPFLNTCAVKVVSYSQLYQSDLVGTYVTFWVTLTSSSRLELKRDVNWTYPYKPSNVYDGQLRVKNNTHFLYNASLTIYLDDPNNDTTFGNYKLHVCGQVVQIFTVSRLDHCATRNSSLINITPSLIVPRITSENVTLVCTVQGYQPLTLVSWISQTCSDKRCVSSISNQYINSNCNFESSLTIIDVTPKDTGVYTCNLIDSSRNLTTTLTVFDIPTPLPGHTHQTLYWTDPIQLAFTIRGNADYINPKITINDLGVASFCKQCTITMTQSPSQLETTVTFNAGSGVLPPGNYTFRMCLMLNSSISPRYTDRYNRNPNCTTIHLTIRGFQIPLTITLPAGVGGGVVCVVVITVGVLCLCVYRHSHHHSHWRRITNTPSTESLLSGNDVETDDLGTPNAATPVTAGPRKIFVLNDLSTDEATLDLCDILNRLSRAGDQVRWYECDCIQYHRAEIFDSWINWVESKITDSHKVLLICSKRISQCLKKWKDLDKLNITCGELSSATILNIIQGSPGKFLLIFLNQPIDKNLIPTALKENKRFSVDTERAMTLHHSCTSEDELAAGMQRHLTGEAGQDLNCLREYLCR